MTKPCDPALFEAVRAAYKLQEARETLRRFYGDRYEAKMAPFRVSLVEVAAERGCSVMELATAAAKQAARDNDGMLAVMYLAAACDEIEATP